MELTVVPDAVFHFKCWEDDATAGAIRTATIWEGQPTLRAICECDETYTIRLTPIQLAAVLLPGLPRGFATGTW